jgi:hypothetical protein
MLPRAILLGPQRHQKTVAAAVEATAKGSGPVAMVSAGWEERESEDDEFKEHVGRRVVNLRVYQRVEQILADDQELLAAMRQRHETLRKVQELYRLRLSGLMAAARALLLRSGEAALLDPERQGAVAMLQRLDSEHVQRVAAIHAEFAARVRPETRTSVQQQRQALAAELGPCSCLCIAGGHVAVLFHRLALFDLLGLVGAMPVVAWSAGAMVLSPRIVLFHDDPPQGAADAEVMEAGFGALPGIVALPNASRRLRLQDEANVQLMARRFQPDLCVALDPGARLDWDGRSWSAPAATQHLDAGGRLTELSR